MNTSNSMTLCLSVSFFKKHGICSLKTCPTVPSTGLTSCVILRLLIHSNDLL